ncbi:TIGR02302 family protein [Mesorhizobium sp. YM1C-6-2]|uniref:TIGR02302 family protein n=1 Tax=Mesorhizobium sp. YM1C-6-2 TaxID=1827501 RepID=UPI000EF1DC4D|nr:TIGR02302 family protein [Mesorhizobium sp. YM1C-6-2]RLP23947.1 TIGR02302 family protein [Mesorhizobium sp. YM1C-6-2]
MTETNAAGTDLGLTTRLARTRFAVRAAMVVERGWPLVLPLLLVAVLFLSLSWLGVFRVLPDLARLAVVVGFGIAALASLYPLRFYRHPTSGEIDRRIERANELVHTPVLVQTDRPVGRAEGQGGGAFAEALWREHQRRMAASLGGVGGDLPRTRVPERDPWGIRAVAALLLVTAFAFSFGPFGGSLRDGFKAHGWMETVPPRIDAWVTPPAYTGKAPVFLTSNSNAPASGQAANPSADQAVRPPPSTFTVPENSELSLRVTGGSGEETLAFTDAAGNTRDIAPQGAPAGQDNEAADAEPAAAPTATTGLRQFTGKLTTDGVLTLKSGDRDISSWTFAVTPDRAPVIRFSDEPKRAANGALELAYEVEDDYGATEAFADFELEETPSAEAHPLYGAPEMKLTLPRRDAKGPAAKTSRDLTEHVWSGSRIKLTLKAKDAAGQEASSETKTFVMPEKIFTNPLARAVVEHGKIFSLDTNRKQDTLNLIDAITIRPEDTFENPSHYLGIMAGRTQLEMAATDEQLREVADYMWEMALSIEDGDLSAAEKRLRQAQEALQQALENNASEEEIDKLMAELREAMDEFLREFAERAMQNPNMAENMPQNGQELRQNDLQRMLDQIENLAKSGNRDQAKDLLAQLQEMMNNLQAGRQQPGQDGQQNSEMRQQMDKLGEIMRRQQEMMNETFRMDQMQRGQQQQGPGGEQQQGENGEGQQPGQQGQGQQPGQGQPMTPEEFAEAMRQLQQGQGQLQGELEALMKGLEGMGMQPGEGFGEAGDAMGEAEGSLGRGEGDRAVGQQGRALEALRKGAQDMMNQMMQAQQGEEGGGQEGGRQQNADRDPLGRPRATRGPDFGDSVTVPDEIDVQRARQILEAIRKRLGNALSPELERSYLERLLEMK